MRLGLPVTERAIRSSVGGSPATILEERRKLEQEHLAETTPAAIHGTGLEGRMSALIAANQDLVKRAKIAEGEAEVRQMQIKQLRRDLKLARRMLLLASTIPQSYHAALDRLGVVVKESSQRVDRAISRAGQGGAGPAVADNKPDPLTEQRLRRAQADLVQSGERLERLRALYYERTGEFPPDNC